MSKWRSEEIWREALDLQLRQLRDAEQPGFVLYHHGKLDEAFTDKHRQKLRRRIERILASGERGWTWPERP